MQKRTLASIIGTAAAVAAVAFTGSQEGISNTPYRDSGGVWTVCRGQTGVAMRYYTDQECDDMLADTLAVTAAQITANTPGFTTLDDGVKTATVDFTYNVGFGAYTRSTYRQMLIKRELPAACDQIPRYKYVGDNDCSKQANDCYGVWKRRQAERSMCRGDVH
jgi:lysozyme